MTARISFTSAAVALLLLLLLAVLGGAYFPNYDHASQFISELGARQAPHEHLVRWLGFLPAGISMLIFAATAFFALPRSTLTVLGLFGIAIYALGYLAAAIYPCDPGCRPTQPSVSQLIHNTVGLTGYLLAPLSLAVLAWSARHWPDGSYLAKAGFVAAPVALLGLLSLSPESRYAGLSQRLIEMSVLLWVVACGWYIRTRFANAI